MPTGQQPAAMPRKPVAFLSTTAWSNLYTMGVTSAVDPRQAVPPENYTMPPPEVRLLRARLIYEEAMETIAALGFEVRVPVTDETHGYGAPLVYVKLDGSPGADGRCHYADQVGFETPEEIEPDMVGIIDGVCDLQYVGTGTLVACGVPDVPHMDAVIAANDAKLPGGVANVDANGKFQKPPGWQPPAHEAVMEVVRGRPGSLLLASRRVVEVKTHQHAKRLARQTPPDAPDPQTHGSDAEQAETRPGQSMTGRYPKQQPCLGPDCKEIILSTGPGHRLCKACRKLANGKGRRRTGTQHYRRGKNNP